jgi:4-amino-4-deoxy-L-arabinose transferase-like glycosyltransferase
VVARRVALPVAAALLALSAWFYRHSDLPFVILFGDEAEYAEIGRRVATGRGFTTGVIFPIELAYGVGPEHPSLLRPPLWPLALAGSFAIGGASEAAAHAAVALCYAALVALTAALALRLGGPWAAAAATVACVLAADVTLYASMVGTETLTALCVSAWLLAVVAGAHPVLIGAACGFAYLTRYNFGVLLPLSLAALWLGGGPGRARRALACLGGFALVGAPWWIRNAAITGNPFFSYYRVTLWETPYLTAWNGSLLNNLAPGPDSPAWISLPEKLRILLPMSLALWPVPAANLPAFAGAVFGAIRRERACLVLLAALLVNKLAVIPFAVRGRYEIPFVPAAIAVGAAAWWRHGGRLRVPALLLVLAAPWLPTLPLRDAREDFHRGVLDEVRRVESESGGGGVVAAREARLAQQRPCLEGKLLLAADAPTVAWDWDTPVLFTPQSNEELWQMIDRYPIGAAVMPAPQHSDRSRFVRSFAQRLDCGTDVYVRRGYE